MPDELFVSRVGSQTWAALRQRDVLVEFQVENSADRDPVGQIVKGRVTRVLPGIQSAFLDIGLERDAYLHVSDLVPPVQRGPGPPGPRPPIEHSLAEGRDLLVQVQRDTQRAKGARVTCQVALAGRYLVFAPRARGRRVSRRIELAAERERLRGIVTGYGGAGAFIVRTAAQGVGADRLDADAARLREEWSRVQQRFESAPAGSVIRREPELALRLLRDAPTQDLRRVLLDDAGLYRRAVNMFRDVDASLLTRLELHASSEPLFEAYGLDAEIHKALRPKIWLPSGGYVVVEVTEALVSIDVNTGKFIDGRPPRETVLRTNLEAAEEIARQLRLRDLGGIVVIDFIDMEHAEDRRALEQALSAALRHDRSRSRLLEMNEFGLLQLTRKRARRGPLDRLTRTCPLCAGQARIKSPATVASEAVAEVRRLLPDLDAQRLTLRVHPDVARELEAILRTGAAALAGAEVERVEVERDEAVRPDHFDLRAR